MSRTGRSFRHNDPTIDLPWNGVSFVWSIRTLTRYESKHTVEGENIVGTRGGVIIPELGGQEMAAWVVEAAEVFDNSRVMA